MKSFATFLTTLLVSTSLTIAEDKPAADKPAATSPAAEKPVAEKPAAATPAPASADPALTAFQGLDKNSDGMLTLEEYKALPFLQKDPSKAEASFKKRDKDSNGSINIEEYRVGRPTK